MMSVFALMLMLPVAVYAADVQEGEASYYSDKLDGNKTASGEIYDKDALTAAHRTFAIRHQGKSY